QVQPRAKRIRLLLQHAGADAPIETRRVCFHVVDEIEHAIGRPAHDGLAADTDHFGTIATNMGKQKGKEKPASATIAQNKRARHEYHIDEHFEAGVALQGWEVKSLRAGRANLGDAYAIVKGGEIWLFGASIIPLISASTHVVADDRRTRKLLLHRAEIDQLVRAVQRKGYTLIPLSMYWKRNRVKLDLGLARGKQSHDKRDTERERDWNREKQRVMRAKNREA